MSSDNELLEAFKYRYQTGGWTVARLSQETDLSQKTISNCLNGRGNPTIKTWRKLAIAVGVRDVRIGK